MNWLGETALHCAARGGHKDTVELLINNGADIHHKNYDGKNIIQSIYLSSYLFIYLSN